MSRQGRYRSPTNNNIKIFWNREAKDWGNDPRVTIRDHFFRVLEIETIQNFIKGKKRIIDVGCGTGFSSLFYAQVAKSLIGIDYASEMIKVARRFLTDPRYFGKVMKNYADKAPVLLGNLLFQQGNILKMDYPDNSFDAAIVERVLINLPTKKEQQKAISELYRILKSKGTLVLAEVTKQGHQNVDSLRKTFGLPILEKYWHNLYLDEEEFEGFTKELGFKMKKKIILETYQFLTKAIHPLIVKPQEPKFLSGFNKAAQIISKTYPTYKSVKKIGLDFFLKEIFRPILIRYDREKLRQFDQTLPKILSVNPDFGHCSHQIIYHYVSKKKT